MSADDDAPHRSTSLLPQKRQRKPSDDAQAPQPRRTKSVSEVRSRARAPPAAFPPLAGKGKAKASAGRSDGGGGLSAGDAWKGDMFGRFVEKALRDVDELGDTTTYDELLSQLRPSAPDPSSSSAAAPAHQPALIHPLLVALTAHASLLSSAAHRSLIEALIHFPWSTADAGFVETYMRFVGVLVSLRMEWLGEVVKRCVKGLKYQPNFKQLLPAQTSSSAGAPLTRGIVYARQHALLARLLALIPTLPALLLPLLLAGFPPKREPRVAHTVWVRNVLQVSAYCPTVGERVWAAVIGRALQMDVEIQVEWDELEDDDDDDGDGLSDTSSAAGGGEDDPFAAVVELALEDPEAEEAEGADADGALLLAGSDTESDVSDGEDGSDAESDAARRRRLRGIREMAGKLDAVLLEAFVFFSSSGGPNGSAEPPPPPSAAAHALAAAAAAGAPNPLPTPAPSRSGSPAPPPPAPLAPGQAALQKQHQFAALLAVFDRLVLPTFKSRYTQFVLFWFASLSAAFTEDFLGLLVSKALFERDQPEVVRKAAASYVGSFVSRAVWVDRAQVRRVVDLLCQFLDAQLDVVRREPALLGQFAKNGRRTHGLGVFYAVAQAVLLIFCFRWRELRDGGDGEDDEDEGEDLGMDEDGDDDDNETGGRHGRKGKWVDGLAVLERAVLSAFNPLKVCSPNVVGQFARVAHETGFLFVYHIIAANNRQSAATATSTPASFAAAPSLPSASLHQHAAGGGHLASSQLPAPTPRQERDALRPEAVEEADLDSFFPFDPFRLPASARFIDNIYRAWEGGDDDDDDDDDDDESDSSGFDDDGAGEGADTFDAAGLEQRHVARRRQTRLSAGGAGSSEEAAELAELGRSFEHGLSMGDGGARMIGRTVAGLAA